jgi:phenylalanyl-tRNA synthetase alpha chain
VNLAEAQQLLERAESEAATAAETAAELDELAELERRYVGRRSPAAQVTEAIKTLAPEDRRAAGKAVSEYKAAIAGVIERRRAAIVSSGAAGGPRGERLDLTAGGHGRVRGHLHLVTQVQRELEDIFAGLGYRVAEGPEVEDDWHNFEALNIPQDHPARTMRDTLYVSIPGHPELLLRTETSAVQIRTMQSQPPPVYIVAPGRVYRRETADATHLPVFAQVEALVVDEGITFADLKGTLEALVKSLFGEERRIRFTPSYFPFVEPGAQIGVTCFKCGGVGCPTCGNGWIELLGAGMVHPTVLENCGYDSERYTGFAFGLGIERVAILKYAIPDMRMLIDGDVRFLEQFGAA